MDKKFLNVKEVALFGMLGALTFGGKFVMSSLPNIEPVSLFVLVFTVVFGLKSLFPIGIYVTLGALAAAAGKALGGFLGDRFGGRVAGVVSLILAALLFLHMMHQFVALSGEGKDLFCVR